MGEAVVAIVVGVRLTTPPHSHHHHHYFCRHLPSPQSPVNSHHNHHNQTRPSSRRRRPSTPHNWSQSCGASAASDQKIQQKRRRGLQEWSRPSPTTRACKKRYTFSNQLPSFLLRVLLLNGSKRKLVAELRFLLSRKPGGAIRGTIYFSFLLLPSVAIAFVHFTHSQRPHAATFSPHQRMAAFSF